MSRKVTFDIGINTKHVVAQEASKLVVSVTNNFTRQIVGFETLHPRRGSQEAFFSSSCVFDLVLSTPENYTLQVTYFDSAGDAALEAHAPISAILQSVPCEVFFSGLFQPNSTEATRIQAFVVTAVRLGKEPLYGLWYVLQTHTRTYSKPVSDSEANADAFVSRFEQSTCRPLPVDTTTSTPQKVDELATMNCHDWISPQTMRFVFAGRGLIHVATAGTGGLSSISLKQTTMPDNSLDLFCERWKLLCSARGCVISRTTNELSVNQLMCAFDALRMAVCGYTYRTDRATYTLSKGKVRKDVREFDNFVTVLSPFSNRGDCEDGAIGVCSILTQIWKCLLWYFNNMSQSRLTAMPWMYQHTISFLNSYNWAVTSVICNNDPNSVCPCSSADGLKHPAKDDFGHCVMLALSVNNRVKLDTAILETTMSGWSLDVNGPYIKRCSQGMESKECLNEEAGVAQHYRVWSRGTLVYPCIYAAGLCGYRHVTDLPAWARPKQRLSEGIVFEHLQNGTLFVGACTCKLWEKSWRSCGVAHGEWTANQLLELMRTTDTLLSIMDAPVEELPVEMLQQVCELLGVHVVYEVNSTKCCLDDSFNFQYLHKLQQNVKGGTVALSDDGLQFKKSLQTARTRRVLALPWSCASISKDSCWILVPLVETQ